MRNNINGMAPKIRKKLISEIEDEIVLCGNSKDETLKQIANKRKIPLKMVKAAADNVRRKSLLKPDASTPILMKEQIVAIANISNEKEKNDIMNVNKDSLENISRKTYIKLNDKEKEELIKIAKEDPNIRPAELANAFNISITTVNRILSEHHIKLNHKVPHTTIDKATKDAIIKDYIAGFTRERIAEKYKVCVATVSNIVVSVKKDDNTENICVEIKKSNPSTNINDNKSNPTNDESAKETNSSVPAPNENKNNESNIKEKEVVDDADVESNMNNETNKELEKTPTVKISFAGSLFEDSLLRNTKNEISATMMKRHDIVDDNYVFPFRGFSDDNIANILYQEKIVDKFITENFHFNDEGNAIEYLSLKCTGCNIALSSIIAVCVKRHVNLIVNHYEPGTNNFSLHVTVLDCFGDSITRKSYFDDLKCDEVYLYDCTINDVIDIDNLYIISLNSHNNGNKKLYNTKKIITNNFNRVFEIYPKLLQKCKFSTSKNSIDVNEFSTTRETFTVGASLAHYSNF